LCYACRTSREKFVMHTLTRFALTLAQLLVGGYMFGACVLVAHAQAQQQVVPLPPPPAAPPSPPVANPPGPNAVPQPAPVSPPAPSAAPGPSVTSPVNEPRSAAHTHERKTVHHRTRSIVTNQTPPYGWRHYWDPRPPVCPVWDYPYGSDRWQWWWVEARPWWLVEGCPN
jgi:hypothetical protein